MAFFKCFSLFLLANTGTYISGIEEMEGLNDIANYYGSNVCCTLFGKGQRQN